MADKPKSKGKVDPKRAIVLAGGGARGAYEVGVLAYIFEELPEDVVKAGCLRIICGTSVGAIHASYLAGTAHIRDHDIGRLVSVWRDMRIEQMLRLGVADLARLPLEIRSLLNNEPQKRGLFLNSGELEDLIVRDLPWAQVRYNLRADVVDALAVSATHVVSGKTTTFLDQKAGEIPEWSRDPRSTVQRVRISPKHALASASIPILFPAVEIGGTYYCDGGVRQNTPLSPALRLGADKVLVVGLRGEDPPTRPTEFLDGEPVEPYPGPMFLLGKLVDSIMLDRLDYDLKRLEGFNRLLSDGQLAFGDSFVEQINRTSSELRGVGYREVDTVMIRPSRDLGAMAQEFIDVFRSKMGGITGMLFAKISEQQALGGSDLLSYLLFDGRLATALIELGKADADAARDQLIDFFKD